MGRIRINTGNLNLFDTQTRAEGEFVVQARHVLSSLNASINCENLSYNLGSTNGVLHVQNFVSPTVYRFQGTNVAWSAYWTNVQIIITPSYIFSNIVFTNVFTNMTGSVTNMGTNVEAFYSPETNVTYIGLSDTMLDAHMLSSIVPVSVYDLVLHSTNMIINDDMSVISTFLLDGPSFTLDAALTFPGVSRSDPLSGTPFSSSPIQDWVYTMAPSLLYFTNNGSIAIPQDAHFGDDGPTNYLAFVNNGGIYAGSQTINAFNLQVNNGVQESLLSDFSATAVTAVLSNAEIFAEGDIDINAGTLTIDPSVLSAVMALNFDVTTNFSDGGIGSGNAFSCQNGFNLVTRPVNGGNLWGTAITTMSYGDEEVDHTWAGNDLGASAAGFTNNLALYSLVLSPQDFFPYPLFYFSGTNGIGGTGDNALYVGTLDLSQLGPISYITNSVGIDPSLTIYYAHMLLDFTPPGSQTPEQYMDGRFGGHLRWVKGFNALATAALSAAPSPKLSASYSKSQGQVSLTVSGIPSKEYIIQASTNLVTWTPIFTNSTAVNGLLQFLDANTAKYHSRFYRAVPAP